MKVYNQKGSFTIEASLLIPMIIFMMMSAIQGGIDLYQESVERKAIYQLQNWDAVAVFYALQAAEAGEEILND